MTTQAQDRSWRVKLHALPAIIRRSVVVFTVATLALVGSLVLSHHGPAVRPTTASVEASALHAFASQFGVASLMNYSATCVLASTASSHSTYSCDIVMSAAGVRQSIVTATVTEQKISGANDFQATISFSTN